MKVKPLGDGFRGLPVDKVRRAVLRPRGRADVAGCDFSGGNWVHGADDGNDCDRAAEIVRECELHVLLGTVTALGFRRAGSPSMLAREKCACAMEDALIA